MKRRHFLASIAALPLAGCAILKPFAKTESTFPEVRNPSEPKPFPCRMPPSNTIPEEGWALMHQRLEGVQHRLRQIPYEEVRKTFPRKVIDYAHTNEDEFGRVYRRTLHHDMVCEYYVKSAAIMSCGDLFVKCYDIADTAYDVERYPYAQEAIAKHNLFKQVAVSHADEDGFNVVCAILPRDEWVVKQYNGVGYLIREITANDYLA